MTKTAFNGLCVSALIFGTCLTLRGAEGDSAPVPAPTPVTAKTHFITQPLLPDGRVDYVTANERLGASSKENPLENGMRLVIQAVGPCALEERISVKNLGWDKWLSDPSTQSFREKTWIPLCKKLNLDPEQKPKWVDAPTLFDVADALEEKITAQAESAKKEDEKNAATEESDSFDIYNVLSKPFSDREYPEIARWLEENNELIELFARAVAQPVFRPCNSLRTDGKYTPMWRSLSPNTSYSRYIALVFQTRSNYYVNKAASDPAYMNKALDYTISLFCLSKRLLELNSAVEQLFGIICAQKAFEQTSILVRSGYMTDQQLERLDKAIAEQTPSDGTERMLFSESLFAFDVLQELLRNRNNSAELSILSGMDEPSLGVIQLLRSNLSETDIRLKFRSFFDKEHAALHEKDPFIRREKAAQFRQEFSADSEKCVKAIAAKQGFSEQPSEEDFFQKIRECTDKALLSEFVARLYYSMGINELEQLITAFQLTQSEYVLCRIGVAVERYKLETGAYPPTLEELVPRYLDAVPVEPSTGKKTIVYRPEGATFILYAWGDNLKDDQGKKRSNIPMENNFDIVF